MRPARQAIDAVEFIVHDLLALMLRANQNGFSARDVLAAVEFILVHSRITLDEERMVHEFIEYPDRQSRKRNLKMRH